MQTRKSLGAQSKEKNAQQRRSLGSSSFQKVYPDLTETTSYATTIHTSEQQDDEDIYETEYDTSFASSQGSETSNSKETEIKYGLALIGLILLAIFVGMMISEKKLETDSSYEKYIKSVRFIINTHFPNVSKENRDLLRLIGRKVFLEPENHAPLVVLIGGKAVKDFSEAVNQAVQDAKTEEYETTEKKTIRVESNTNRAELHENLRGILGPSLTSQSSPRSAVVLDVDLLKWDAVLVLHAFADHEKYPVPKTILFLTVSEFDELSNEESCDEKMVRFLTTRWIDNGGSSDNIPPIIARISYFLCV